jgi:GrpB-like predicted nucleotidyltransferase (UPF0157 family)
VSICNPNISARHTLGEVYIPGTTHLCPRSLEAMKVTVESYNPKWATDFEQIKAELETALQGVNFISIEHVGSTSVAGLAAKPIIDISVISEREDVTAAIEALTANGLYTYLGEMGIPDRHGLKWSGTDPARNLYVCVKGCQSVRNHLALREVCRRNETVREVYGKKKLELATREWKSVDEYCEAKNEVISWALQQAGMSEEERKQITELNTL